MRFADGGCGAGGPTPAQIVMPRSTTMIMAVLFWALALVSAVLSQVPYISFIYFCFFSVFLLTALLVLTVPDAARFLKIVFAGIGGVMALLALCSLVQYFGFNATLAFDGRTSWPLANPNSLAGVYMMGIFGAIGLMLGARDRLQSNAGLLLAIVLAAALFTTGSRGAFIALLAGLAVLFVLTPGFVKIHRRCVSIFAVVSVLIFIAAIVAVPDGAYTLGGALKISAQSAEPLQTRPAIWMSTWHIIQDHFWAGTGIGTFYLYYPQYRGADYYSAGYMAHNDVLQFWSEMGVVALALLIGFVVFGLRRMKRALAVLAVDDRRRVLIAAPFCALGAMALNSQVTYHFYVLPMLVLAGLALGWWFRQTQEIAGRGDFTIHFPSAKTACGAKFISLLPLVLGLYGFTIMQGSYILTARAETRMKTGDLEGFSKDVNDAAALSHNRNDRAFILAATIPIGILETQGANLPANEIDNLYKQGVSLLDRAQALNARSGPVFYYRAALSRAAGKLLNLSPDEQPEKLLYQALALDPQYAGARLLLTDVYEAQGQGEKALAVLREGLQWSYVYSDKTAYLERTARMALAQGDMDTNREALAQLHQYRQYEQDKAGRSPHLPLDEFRNFMNRR